MRTVIGQDLIRRLPRANRDIRDTKLTGFLIRCRPSGQHSYVVQLGRGHYETIGRVATIGLAEARAAAEQLRGDLSTQALVARGDDAALTMAQARATARATVQARRRQTRKASTFGAFVLETYGPWALQTLKRGQDAVDRLRNQFAEFQTMPLGDLSAFAVERWRTARLKGGTKPSTVNRDLAGLRSALSMARKWKLLTAHPMTDVKAAAVDKIGHVRFLSADEEKRLTAALAARDERRRAGRETANVWRQERGYDEMPPYGPYTDHLTPLVVVAMHTGCRRGELFGLRWRDVDLGAARLTVEGDGAKSGKTRVLPLNTAAVSTLKAWRPATAAADTYVFPGDDGAPLTDLKSSFLKLMKDAKIIGFRFHDLRHDFASKLVQRGVDLNTVRELLGHADLKMTIRYAHLAPEHKAAAVAKLVGA